MVIDTIIIVMLRPNEGRSWNLLLNEFYKRSKINLSHASFKKKPTVRANIIGVYINMASVRD